MKKLLWLTAVISLIVVSGCSSKKGLSFTDMDIGVNGSKVYVSKRMRWNGKPMKELSQKELEKFEEWVDDIDEIIITTKSKKIAITETRDDYAITNKVGKVGDIVKVQWKAVGKNSRSGSFKVRVVV